MRRRIREFIREMWPTIKDYVVNRSKISIKKVLIVDDDMFTAESIAVFLHKKGYKTYIALSGKEALERAKEVIPDMVIIDFILPDICGSEVASGILETVYLKSTKICFITAKLTDEEEERIKMIANRYVLSKPCSPEDILRITTELIGPVRPKGFLSVLVSAALRRFVK